MSSNSPVSFQSRSSDFLSHDAPSANQLSRNFQSEPVLWRRKSKNDERYRFGRIDLALFNSWTSTSLLFMKFFLWSFEPPWCLNHSCWTFTIRFWSPTPVGSLECHERCHEVDQATTWMSPGRYNDNPRVEAITN